MRSSKRRKACERKARERVQLARVPSTVEQPKVVRQPKVAGERSNGPEPHVPGLSKARDRADEHGLRIDVKRMSVGAKLADGKARPDELRVTVKQMCDHPWTVVDWYPSTGRAFLGGSHAGRANAKERIVHVEQALDLAIEALREPARAAEPSEPRPPTAGVYRTLAEIAAWKDAEHAAEGS